MGKETVKLVDNGTHMAVRFVQSARPLTRTLGKLENLVLKDELESIDLHSPIYITGLARAGSTILLEMLASHPDVATHRYSDFPFVDFPFLWHKTLKLMPRKNQVSKERPHGDGIAITSESPEAMEEMIWMDHFAHLHNPTMVNTLDKETSNTAFETAYPLHLKKILLARENRRYVGKNNYNLTRLAYLHSLFPDARFIVPVRDPASHIASLMRQHDNFRRKALQDRRIVEHMRLAGHFEFGEDLRLVRFNEGQQMPTAGTMQVENWAEYWNLYYGHALKTISQTPTLRDKVLWVPHERFCQHSEEQIREILTFASLSHNESWIKNWAQKASSPLKGNSFSLIERDQIQVRTAETYEKIKAASSIK